MILPAECSRFVHNWPDVGGNENGGFASGGGQTDDVYIVDVDGVPAVIVASHWLGSSDAEIQELEGVVDSISFIR